MVGTEEYILGADPEELARLRFQHTVWVEKQYALLARAGVGAGDRVLDLGCGPGATSFELARVVGPEGRVIARDQSAAFLAALRRERDARGLSWIETSEGPVEELDLAAGSLDAVYARWLLCWLPDPAPVVAAAARALRPGGVCALQEYLDWGSMKLLPRAPAFDRGVAACMRSWDEGGANIDIGERLPDLARSAGLAVESLRPVARLGAVGSLEWRWLGTFFAAYLPKLIDRGLFTREELDAWHAEWQRRTDEGTSYCYTPTMLDVVLRKR